MKILHVISSGGLYGAEAVILNLSLALAEQGDVSEIGIFDNQPHPNHDLQAAAMTRSVSTHPITCHGQLDLSVPGRVRDLAHAIGADVVHAHGYKADLYTWAALRTSRIPLVSTCHTWYDNSTLLRAYGALDRSILRRFAAVIAVSNEVRQRLLASGIPSERVTLIPNGIDTRPFATPPITTKRKPDGPLLVGLVGRLSQEKGVDLFLHAAARVLRDQPETRFQIIGDGPDRPALEHLIATLGLGDRITLLGRRDNMPEIYASLDILVSASRQEGLPITLLEAMASALPILATSVGEVPSLIRDRHTGLLVPPDNVDALATALHTLLTNPALRQQLGENARNLVETSFSARQMTAHYHRIYTSVLAATLSKGAAR